MTEAQKRAQQKYFKKTVQFVFRVNPETEPDVYEKLKNKKNRSAYLKELVRSDG